MTDYISAELAATCAALGYYDGQKYYLDKNCLDVIKDLIKYLKRDDETHTIRRYLGQTKLLQSDLLKIFVQYSDKLDLWDVLLRLIINLTSPALLIYNEKIPMEKTMRSYYLQIISYLQSYKVALADDQVWQIVNNRLTAIFSIDNIERGEENEMIIERILALIRNVLQVPPDENEKRPDNDATIHDQVLFALHASGIVDILLFIASSAKEQQYHLQILEIISLMLCDQNASQLATAGLQRSTIEKAKDEAHLLSIRQKEKLEKFEKLKKYAGARHSRFGGTYVVQNMKAIGDNQMLCHKPYEKVEALEFNSQKTKVKKPKNRLAMADSMHERVSALSVRLFLKEFCVEFLNGVYNPVMKHAKSCIISDVQCNTSESSCYLWALRFFMEFNRCYKFQVKYVCETISTEEFYIIQRQMSLYYEMILTDKERIRIWSHRLHLALKAYKELLHTLMAMDKSPDQSIREPSKVIKSNVFYVPEYRETILSQLLNFDELKMSRKYLIDLVTTAHIFLKMLEQFCAKGQRSLIVQKLKKKRQKSRKHKPVSRKEETPAPSLEDRWDDLAPELSVVMQGVTIPEMIPFDATLDIPVDDQKSDAMKKIQKLLRMRFYENAVGLFRACREVWPENDSFGRADIPPEEEFLALREIFFADLGVVEDDLPTQQANQENNFEDNFTRNGEEEEEEDEEEENDDHEDVVTEETDFKLNEFVQRFANIKIVKALNLLLQQFDKNTKEVNHYVTKMLHRIAFECKMPAMIFQASIFRTFQKILESKHPEHKELQKFAIFIIRRFVEVAQKNRKSYMELLFWKNAHDATQIVEGYNTETDKKKVSRGVWTEAEEDELRTLFMEHQTNKPSEDLIDWILERLINETRTRRGVIKKLKEMCLVVNSKAVRNEIQKRLPKEWSEEEIAQLTELWEQLREDEDPVELIFNGLKIKRTKPKIKEKLLELGLAKDPKELYKKRSKKSNHGKSSWETQSGGNSDDEDRDSEEESRKSSGRNDVAQNKPTNKRKTTTTTTTKTKAGRSRRKKDQKTFLYTDAQLSGLLKNIIEGSMTEPLEWIKESLEDALDDRNEESTEGIPLVPLTESSSNAIDSINFQKLLRAMGMQPPMNEQEIYWRIPANMLNSTIRKRCKLIADGLEGKFIVEEVPSKKNINDDIRNNSSDESDDDIDVLESIKKFFTKKDRLLESLASTSRVVDVPLDSDKSEKSTKRDVQETADTIEIKEVENGKNQEETLKRISKRRVKLLSDSSESEPEIERNADEPVDEAKRNRSQSFDTEAPSSKKPRLLDSDEDSETSQIKNSKPTIALESDNEEDNQEKNSIHKSTISQIIDSDEESVTEKTRNLKSTRKIISDDEEDN
ncbi:PREDICTED: protein timeless homolog isoform X1 [Polistes canadensis]|uniref:protein timeless homolog isoform X1 n=1 Tax=Polistes canadensis TaxID=91411 RepID=UPI000719066F|nr:PREDICTED: protein timeless homolog isoform X1 [Polistes canadensis]